jgi:serine protease Do/serine protease DegQ
VKQLAMKGTLVPLLAILCVSLVQAALPAQDSQGRPLPTLAPLLKQVTPAVVNISTQSYVAERDNPLLQDPFFRRFFGLPERQPRQRRSQSLGSGVIVDAENGYVLTNNHVVGKASEISVQLLDGRVLAAELVGADPEADVAVVQIPAEGLTALPMADSDVLQVGDFVVAIGNPFGLGQTVTSGIVSALGRSGLGIEGYEDFIQTDASINPGNSGGALINLRGELVGINTAIVAPGGGNVGIGFAIPANMARALMEQLVAFGEIRRGRLGVSGQTLNSALAKAFDLDISKGVLISSVEPGAAADRAGLKVGDVVVGIDGREVEDTADLRNALGVLRAGAEVELEVMRAGRLERVRAKIDAPAQQQFEGRQLSPRLEGLLLGDIGEDSPLYGKVDGLLVLDVAPGSYTWRAGLRKGDVIVSVNRRQVTSREAMIQALQQSPNRVLLNIRRANRALFVLL